jgi:hypothetical protein
VFIFKVIHLRCSAGLSWAALSPNIAEGWGLSAIAIWQLLQLSSQGGEKPDFEVQKVQQNWTSHPGDMMDRDARVF